VSGMDMNKMLQQVQQMQEQMQKAQQELKNEIVEATAGGGMVKVTATGGGEIRGIKIDPKAIDPDDPEMLEDMVVAAVNEAMRSAQSLMETKLGPELDDTSLERLAEATKEVETPAGQVLVQPGIKGTGMFFIAEGAAIVETKLQERELGPGEFFGELALMREDATRTARVRAKTPLRCLALDRAAFRKLVAEQPEVAASLLEIALSRLAENAGVPRSA
jgi:nucleoid-associated protein EbfC